jgi:hypothetical protein
VGPRDGLDDCGELAPNGIRCTDRPALSELLHRLSYRGPHCPRSQFRTDTWRYLLQIVFVVINRQDN